MICQIYKYLSENHQAPASCPLNKCIQMPFVELDFGSGFLLCSSLACFPWKTHVTHVTHVVFLWLFGCAVSFQGCNFVAKSARTEVWSHGRAQARKIESNTWPTLARLFGNLSDTMQGAANQKAKSFLRTWTRDATNTAAGLGQGKKRYFGGVEGFLKLFYLLV